MAVNRYFQNYPRQGRLDNESELVEDLLIESIQVMGTNVYYIPRESFDAGDMIFGEYSKTKFKKAFLIEAYVTPADHFEGQGDFFSKFGLEIKDQSSFTVAKKTFAHLIPSPLRSRPQEGDLIYSPVLHRMFEIKFIEEENLHFTLGKRSPYLYEMKCELFRFSQEPIDTGVGEVDKVAAESSYTIMINLDTSGTGVFNEEAIAFQSPDKTYAHATAQGIVKEWYKANGSLFLYSITGDFKANSNVYAVASNAVYKMIIKDDKSDFVVYDIYDNKDLDTGSDLVLDKSEVNPLGKA